jgi:hypothetical protein
LTGRISLQRTIIGDNILLFPMAGHFGPDRALQEQEDTGTTFALSSFTVTPATGNEFWSIIFPDIFIVSATDAMANNMIRTITFLIGFI